MCRVMIHKYPKKPLEYQNRSLKNIKMYECERCGNMKFKPLF